MFVFRFGLGGFMIATKATCLGEISMTKHKLNVGATKGTYRRDIKMILNHDYIKQCIIFAKKFLGLIILANIVYFQFN